MSDYEVMFYTEIEINQGKFSKGKKANTILSFNNKVTFPNIDNQSIIPNLDSVKVKTYSDLLLRLQCDYLMANNLVGFYIDGDNQTEFAKSSNQILQLLEQNHLNQNVYDYNSFNINSFWQLLGYDSNVKVRSVTRKSGYIINGIEFKCEAYELRCYNLEETRPDSETEDFLKVSTFINNYDFNLETPIKRLAFDMHEIITLEGMDPRSVCMDKYTHDFDELEAVCWILIEQFCIFDFTRFILKVNEITPLLQLADMNEIRERMSGEGDYDEWIAERLEEQNKWYSKS